MDATVLSVPKMFPPDKDLNAGSKAEKDVFQELKNAASKIKDLSLIMFNGVRTTGVLTHEKEKNTIREIDFRKRIYVF